MNGTTTSVPHRLQPTIAMNPDAVALLSPIYAALDRPGPIISERIRRYLGNLLAATYAREDAEQDARARFADLLANLDLSARKPEECEADHRRLLLAVVPALRRFAISLTRDSISADDLVQNTLMRAWKNRAKFAPGSNFEAWTFTILRNQFYSDHRKHREVQDVEGVHSARLIGLPEQTGRLDLQDFQAALNRLAPAMREALMLVTVEDKTYEEAAHIMGCQVGTVKSRASRARAQLARMLDYEENCHDSVMLSALV